MERQRRADRSDREGQNKQIRRKAVRSSGRYEDFGDGSGKGTAGLGSMKGRRGDVAPKEGRMARLVD
jgi:hypothetical protein